MFKNYLFLFRGVKELSLKLTGSSIADIYSQEKNKLNLHIPSEELPYRHLILNTDSLFNFPLPQSERRKAKKNALNFWNEFLPSKIASIKIAEGDRVIKISSDKFDLYFTVWGGLSNVFFLPEGNKHSSNDYAFKNVKDQSMIDKIVDMNYISPLSPFTIEYDDYSAGNLKDKLFYFRKDYLEEFNIRKELSGASGFDIVQSIINETLEGEISISELEPGKLKIHPSSFHYFRNAKHIATFNSINEAVRAFAIFSFREKDYHRKKKDIESKLSRELHKVSNRLNDLKARIDRGSQEEPYRKYADLLLANKNKMSSGLETIELEDFYSGEKIIIKLDPKLNAERNIDKYYDKARDEKISYAKSAELYSINENNFNLLIELQNSLNDISHDKLNEKYEELFGGKKKMKIKQPEIKYKHYLAEGKYHIFVGRDNKNNDMLTFKFAKQNDYWLHARGYPGSHVVLRVDNPKEGIPKNIIKTAASLAAYHSKAKTAGLVPVIYTFRKYVRKSKGMAPGKVAVQKENSVIVPPEIPKNCEFLEE